MIEVLEKAVEKVRRLPPERQERAAAMLEEYANASDDIYVLSSEEELLIDEAIAELDRGEFVTAEQMRPIFDKYRL